MIESVLQSLLSSIGLLTVRQQQDAAQDSIAMTDAFIGKQLGDYQIRGLLGRGGMARVYAGYDPHLDRLAAVKVITNDYAPEDRAEYFERFQREARAIARLNHPNIVGVYQFGQYEDLYYMAMVFVEGRDLRQVLRDYHEHAKLMPFSDVLNVVRGIGSALDYAHARGVIHRDVKPSNIMIARDGRAVLTDFGLALSTSDTTLGETFGSAHYIAPEQAISSANATAQSDLYSLGVCVYEMLTGRVPFDDPSAMTAALKHLQEPPPPPRQLNPDISPAVEFVLLRALEKEPVKRYTTGVEFARALKAAYETQQLPETISMPLVMPPGSTTLNVKPDAKNGKMATTNERRSIKALPRPNALALPDPATATINVSETWDSWDKKPGELVISAPKPSGRRRSPVLILGILALILIVLVVGASRSGLFTPASSTKVTQTPIGTGSTGQPGTPGTSVPVIEQVKTASATPFTRSPVAAQTIAPTITASNIATTAAPTLTSTASLTNTITPSATNTPTNGPVSIQLVYDDKQLDFINNGPDTIYGSTLSKLSFKQGSINFNASSWVTFAPNHSSPPQTCFQALRHIYKALPTLPGCSEVATFTTINEFWIATDSSNSTTTPQVTTFDVLIDGKIITTCNISAGQCTVNLSAGS